MYQVDECIAPFAQEISVVQSEPAFLSLKFVSASASAVGAWTQQNVCRLGPSQPQPRSAKYSDPPGQRILARHKVGCSPLLIRRN